MTGSGIFPAMPSEKIRGGSISGHFQILLPRKLPSMQMENSTAMPGVKIMGGLNSCVPAEARVLRRIGGRVLQIIRAEQAEIHLIRHFNALTALIMTGIPSQISQMTLIAQTHRIILNLQAEETAAVRQEQPIPVRLMPLRPAQLQERPIPARLMQLQ